MGALQALRRRGRAVLRLNEGHYPPLFTPKPLGPEIWTVDGPAIRFYGMPFPTRMVVVRLGDALWLHSPVAWTGGLDAALGRIGRVAFLVAPNPIHYWYLPDWAKRHPGAEVHAAPGVAARAASRGVAFPAHEVLGDTPPDGWAGAIDQRLIPGHPFLKEVVFFHRASGTLILADLIENFEPGKLSLPLRLAARIAGILAPRGRTPVDARLTWHDRAAAREAIREVIGWAPARIAMAHGAIIERDATARLRAAFA